MKVEILTLHNIGPFVGNHRVEFFRMEEFFLISGNTGSGKTTLLDAITYALYGKLPGARDVQGGTAHLRSDFCKENEESFVELIFSLKGQVYKIIRTLPFGKKGESTEFYSMKNIDDKNPILLSNSQSEAKNMILNLLQLSAEEFSKIVLLPQGDFATFLRQNSTERKKLLLKLFPVKFDEIVSRAKNESDIASVRLKEIQNHQDAICQEYDAENYESEAKSILENIEKNDLSQEKLKKELLEIIEQIPNLENLENLQNTLATSRSNFEICDKDLAEQNQKMLAIKSEREKISQKENRQKELILEIDAQNKSLESIENLKSNLESQEKIYRKLEDAEKKRFAINENIANMQNFIASTENIAKEKSACETELKNLCDDREILKKQEKVKSLETILSQKQSELESLSQTNLSQVKLIEELESQIKKEEQNNLAAILSQNLMENEPCPVCGATHHPTLAIKSERNISLQENLNLQNKQKEICDKSIANLQKEISQKTGEIAAHGDILKQKTRFDIQKTEETISEKESLIASFQKKIEEREFAINDLSKQQNEMTKILSQITEIQANKAALSQEIEIQKTQISQVLKNLNAENITLETINASKSALEKNIANSKDEKNILQNQIEEFYKNEKDCDKKISQLKERKINLEQSIANAQIAISNVLKKLSQDIDTKKISQEKNKIQNQKIKIESDLKILSQKNTQLNAQLANLQNLKNQFERLEKERLETQEKAAHYKRLYDVLCGSNSKKIDLTSWVLQMYLEEIVRFANLRMEKISGGRYSMLVNPEKQGGNAHKGLDIEIFDSYTGKSRPCTTLSGGETFMASISLALAISDSVLSRNGGVQLDSLFVDEGFGSLDDQALENAISILDEIRGMRQVGIISHVGDLQQRIKSQIIVKKSAAGSTVEI